MLHYDEILVSVSYLPDFKLEPNKDMMECLVSGTSNVSSSEFECYSCTEEDFNQMNLVI